MRLLLLQSIIELSRTQDEEVGDGTTSVIILGGSLYIQDEVAEVVQLQLGSPQTTNTTLHWMSCIAATSQLRLCVISTCLPLW